MCDEARQEEMAARSGTFDPARPPLPVAISTRMLVKLYDRVFELETRLQKLDKLDAPKAPKAAQQQREDEVRISNTAR